MQLGEDGGDVGCVLLTSECAEVFEWILPEFEHQSWIGMGGSMQCYGGEKKKDVLVRDICGSKVRAGSKSIPL